MPHDLAQHAAQRFLHIGIRLGIGWRLSALSLSLLALLSAALRPLEAAIQQLLLAHHQLAQIAQVPLTAPLGISLLR